jgi:hypothetical protein
MHTHANFVMPANPTCTPAVAAIALNKSPMIMA